MYVILQAESMRYGAKWIWNKLLKLRMRSLIKMKIKINEIELAYEKLGRGKPLLLLHGNGEDHHIFDKLAAKLQNDFTVYAIDSRNHGESTSTEDFSYETMAEDIYLFIKTLQLGKVNLIGFSDGAIIALLLSLKHMECLQKMALLGANLTPEDFTEESYQFVKEMYEETKNPLFQLMLEQPNIEVEDLKRITIPALVVGGEKDIFKPDTFITIANALSRGKLMIMKGHEHDSYITNQDILYTDFLEFFK